MQKQIKDQNYVNILGINILSTQTSRLITDIKKILTYNSRQPRKKPVILFTVNPELVMLTQSNRDLFKCVSDADLLVPDGVGLNYASKFLYGKKLNIIPGRKLFERLTEMCRDKKFKVFLLGGKNGEAELTATKLAALDSKQRVSYAPGPRLDGLGEPVKADRHIQNQTLELINRFKPDLLFVAFGNPKQEFWISKNIDKLNVGMAMTVGGAFRYISGLSKLPPRWMERMGLEWLWRLITEPVRFIRILNAVLIFPIAVAVSKFRSSRFIVRI